MLISIVTPTHQPTWIGETWQSLKRQSYENWEWIVLCNGSRASEHVEHVRKLTENDPRVRVDAFQTMGGIGAIKNAAFHRGTGELLVELDHDDMLTPDALSALKDAAASAPDCGFFYSDCVDFSERVTPATFPQGTGHTYMADGARVRWEACGWRFREEFVNGPRPGTYLAPYAFAPSAAAMTRIMYAPNHVRAWRRTVYHALGGHDPRLDICDDHDLLVRTYLHTRMQHIPKVLYLYRCSGANTWAQQTDRISALTTRIGNENLEKLVLREAQLRSLPAIDLGSGADGRWLPTNWPHGADRTSSDLRITAADLTQRWPWPDSSVFAFRAHDLLEHLPDKMHAIRELHRCLVPGGWLLSSTPSTDGRGAFQDPTHVSYWNENSWWYWTRDAQAAYIGNTDTRFAAYQLYTHAPTPWHEQHKILYTVANLIALKSGYQGPHGY